MTGHSRFWNLSLLIFGLTLGTLLTEVMVRSYSRAMGGTLADEIEQWDPFAVQIEPHGELGYRQKPNSVFHYANGTVAKSNGMGFRGPEVSVHRAEDTFRIILFGGSTTHGWGVNDNQTIDFYMRQILQQRYPGHRFEVISLAFDGYDSYQVFERLRSNGVRLEPSLVIVNSGVNDVRNARYSNLVDRDPRTLIWESVLSRQRDELRRGRPTLWAWLQHFSYALRLPGIVRNHLHRWSRTNAEMRNADPNPQAADYFEMNLRRIAGLTAGDSIPLIFSTPASSLTSKYEPHDISSRDYWLTDASTTQLQRNSLAERMQRVVAQLQASGRKISYISHDLPPNLFLDDAHLTPEGNRQVATNFVNALSGFIRPRRMSRDQERRLYNIASRGP